MNEEDLRAMVRESIARQLGGDTLVSATTRLKTDATHGPGVGSRASFVRLPLLSGGDDDGACLIEPAVRCHHCGYCLSLGH